ncbi:EP300-interacting inhibitor of differentiation 3 [Sorex araneus]|uniref:EP300-interacting inhibitor of differentiation 3 n=1 Tax=Sorex araneus TaxID=42254 RepID=UPI002433C4E1|nr:EP300-interacting inhibitor of differentiation 3 [Sorex araneus]
MSERESDFLAESGEEPVAVAGRGPGVAPSRKLLGAEEVVVVGDDDDDDTDSDEDEPMKVEVAVGAGDSSSDELGLGGAAALHPFLLGAVDQEKCRSIRKQYRRLIHTVQESRDDIVHTASDTLSEALEEANVLFDEVSRTQEAALDAQFLVLASDLGKEKARQLNADMSFFNQVAFCDYLLVSVGLSWLERGDPGGGEPRRRFDDRVARSFWALLQREAASWLRHAEPFHFVFGTFQPERPAASALARPRAALHAARKARRPADEVRAMPTKLRRLDLNAQHEATEKEVERILGLLQTYFRKYPDTPVSYFEFVIDPKSFSRTVENIFYVSFIIRDGFARLRLDQDRLPILEPISFSRRGEDCDFGYHGRKQGVISLSLQDWKNIVATFEISEAMITSAC